MLQMLKHKFLSNKDFEIGNDKKEILKIWCMKEVLYKVKKEQTILFNAHLFIQKNQITFLGFVNIQSIHFHVP